MTVDEYEITCPSCRNAIFVSAADSSVQCGICGDEILLAGHICPDCSTYHEDNEVVCSRCGTPLTRVCGKCRYVNWSGHEHCLNCGESLDILTQFQHRKTTTTADRLQNHMESATELKQSEETASIDRMSELLAIEERRLADIRRQSKKRKRDERRMIFIVSAALVVLLLAAIVLALVGNLT